MLKPPHELGLDRTEQLTVPSGRGPAAVSPPDVVVAALPDPAALGDACAATPVVEYGSPWAIRDRA